MDLNQLLIEALKLVQTHSKLWSSQSLERPSKTNFDLVNIEIFRQRALALLLWKNYDSNPKNNYRQLKGFSKKVREIYWPFGHYQSQ